MSSLILILAVLSLPIFTIYGFISFLRLFFGGSSVNQNQLINEFIADLEAIKSKKTSVTEVLSKYRSKVTGTPSQPPITPETPIAKVAPIPLATTPAVVTEDKSTIGESLENWWENWYQDNNINLLLYIGAFLIVSSAAIFVGFNWENFTGSFKALILSLITIAFFSSGFFFYFQTPKLRNAGSTFLAIGSLLIPFNGLAWYNFVFRETDIGFGMVWLITSVVAALVYFVLAILIKNRFYTYIAGLGSLSLIEALVNISALDTKYYILGGIFSAFTLLAGSKLIASTKKEDLDRLYSEPLNLSSQITMPIFLVWGLMVASSQGQLFTIEATLSTVLACLFYLLTFTIKRNVIYLVLSELLLAMSLVLGLKTFNQDGAIVYSAIFLLCLVYQLGAYSWKKTKTDELSYYTIFTATFISLLALPFAFVDPLINANQQVYFTVVVSLLAGFSAFVERQTTYLYFTIAGLDLALFVFITSVLGKTDSYNNLGLYYAGIATALTGLSWLKVGLADRWKQVLIAGSYFNLLLAASFNLNNPVNLLLISLLILGIGTAGSYLTNNKDSIYSPAVATFLAIIAVLLVFILPSYTKTDQIYFSIIFSCIAAVSTYLEKKPEFLYLAFAGIDLATYLQISKTDLGEKTTNYQAMAFAALATIQYLLGLLTWKKFSSWSVNFLIFSAINFAIAVCFALPSSGYSLFVSALITIVAFSSVWVLRKIEVGYIGTLFAIATVFNLFRFYGLGNDLYPLAFAALSYSFYFASFVGLPEIFQKICIKSGLIIGVGNPVVFGLYSQSDINNNNYYYRYDNYDYGPSPYQSVVKQSSLELYSLISSYLSTLIFAIESYRTKAVTIGYFASVIGLITVLWQYKFLEFDELQIYSITTAVYLFIIGYTRERFGSVEERKTFDFAALAILLLPALGQALPQDGFWYALLLGAEGLILLVAGLSTNHKIYTYAGVAAVIVATLTRVYSFIASLGSWAIIGSLGLIFLAVAIFLMSKRKD